MAPLEPVTVKGCCYYYRWQWINRKQPGSSEYGCTWYCTGNSAAVLVSIHGNWRVGYDQGGGRCSAVNTTICDERPGDTGVPAFLPLVGRTGTRNCYRETGYLIGTYKRISRLTGDGDRLVDRNHN